MNNYEINKNTIALIYDDYKTIIYEKNNKYVINKLPNEIIKYSCEFFGCSFKGRLEGTKLLTGITHKSPIIIEESDEIIFFPIVSYRLNSCSWIRNKYIKKYEKCSDNRCKITFCNGTEIEVDCSFETIDNQVLRSSRLESIIRYRKSVNFV